MQRERDIQLAQGHIERAVIDAAQVDGGVLAVEVLEVAPQCRAIIHIGRGSSLLVNIDHLGDVGTGRITGEERRKQTPADAAANYCADMGIFANADMGIGRLDLRDQRGQAFDCGGIPREIGSKLLGETIAVAFVVGIFGKGFEINFGFGIIRGGGVEQVGNPFRETFTDAGNRPLRNECGEVGETVCD